MFSDVVDTSSNLATVNIIDGKVLLHNSIRSSTLKNNNKLAEIAEKIGIKTKANIEKFVPSTGRHFDEKSKLRDMTLKAYKDFTGKDMKVTVIHAGIETGVFASKYPNIKPISFGPNIYNLHSQDEKIDISSANRIYDFIRDLIKEISKN